MLPNKISIITIETILIKDLLPNARSLTSFYWNSNDELHGQVNVKYSDTARSIQKWLFNSF